MAEFTPTASQRAAIETRGRTVLVSAAAGSGKTKVLTERLLTRISSDADIDSFLVITFTRAAAAELKSRITQEISSRLASDPDNRRLRRQSALVQKASIGTIHSFCSNLLRENCHAAGISPEFRVIEDDRAELIRRRVIERVLDKAYEDPTESFKLLADTVGRGRDDKRLCELVLSLHKKLQSHARPDKWARLQAERFEQDFSDMGDTVWGREIMDAVRSDAAFWADCMDDLCRIAASDPDVMKAYGDSLSETALSLRDLSRAYSCGWDSMREKLPVEFPKLSPLRNPNDPELAEHIKQVRKLCSDTAKKYPVYMSAPSEKLMREIRAVSPVVRALCELVLDFDRAYTEDKRRRSELDFSDLEHLTVRLLTDDEGLPTPLAKELSQRFTEIMVDEYQDVNAVQDAIFRALSRDGENLFMVGDVKQSIYRFRLADPTIFTEKYLSYSDLETADGTEPVRIMLQENFRSRSEIINAANHIFGTCMSQKLGELDYDENAMLRCGASYEGSGSVPELMLVDTSSDTDKERTEAQAVADRINELMRECITVTDGGVQRPLAYGDIAIIMRAANSVGGVYHSVLTEAGIPVASVQGGDFFSSVEISAVMCTLAIIENPHRDVPLIAVLRSPAFGFTADELSEIRAVSRDTDFYSALQKKSETDEKCADFLEKLQRLRSLAPESEPGELLRRIYDELDLEAVCSAMTDGEERLMHLRQLLGYAVRFASTGYRGLHRFTEWLRTLADKGDSPGSGETGNAVRIMTVHKSKGLEFPVVFLCDTSRRFNVSDTNATMLTHPELGFGPRFTDTVRGIEYPTAAMTALKLRLRREMLSEEMRLLYVAVTRARERLIITASVKDPEKTLNELMSKTVYPPAPELLMLASNPSVWLMQALLSDESEVLSLRIARPSAEDREKDACPAEMPAPDPEIIEKLRFNLAYVYPHDAALKLPSKLTATELKRVSEPDPESMSLIELPQQDFRSPDFMKNDKPLTGTERGIAMHALLQYIDYTKALTLDGLSSEVARLCASKHLSPRQAQAIDPEKIRSLFSSPLGRRILNADDCRREFRFSLLCPADEFFPEGADENVLMQGVIDCFIEENGELTVIDYKTDKVYGEAVYERAQLYKSQLNAYASALRRITGKPVKECILYFILAGKAVYL